MNVITKLVFKTKAGKRIIPKFGDCISFDNNGTPIAFHRFRKCNTKLTTFNELGYLGYELKGTYDIPSEGELILDLKYV